MSNHDPNRNPDPVVATITIRIARTQRPGGEGTYTVPIKDHTTVLDALEWIKNNVDDTLLFRHSCHHGSCGTCGMIINGDQRLSCTTNAREAAGESLHIEILPLATMTHIGDLAVDPTNLFRDFPSAASYTRVSEVHKQSPVPDEIDHFERFENCIECGLCVSACPVIELRAFMGPAGLSAYNRELDKNPSRSAELIPHVDHAEGVWGCDRHLLCSRVCPTGVYPGKQIAMLQRKVKPVSRYAAP